jgi:transglutaminase-like putative cysteine protease
MPTIYSIKHLTSFRYTPAVGETLMEVRLQPRSDTQQRCIAFSLEVNPHTSVMTYRDFYGNAVHHFDIPGRHETINVTTESTVVAVGPGGRAVGIAEATEHVAL